MWVYVEQICVGFPISACVFNLGEPKTKPLAQKHYILYITF